MRFEGDNKLQPFKHAEDCNLCYAYLTDEGFNRRCGGTGARFPKPVKLPQQRTVAGETIPVEPCHYEGKLVPGPERIRLGIGHVPNWQYCDHPDRPAGSEIVCKCSGCGPGCRGYLAESEYTPPAISAAIAAAGTDKQAHGYAPLYDELTRTRTIRRILEVGVLTGDSIRAWSAAFPRAAIVAADADPTTAAAVAGIPNTQWVKLDVRDLAALDRFAADHRLEFDLIVDDSTHDPAHQLAIRESLWHALKPGGVMVIEDVPDDATFAALIAQGGRGWDNRLAGKWDSRAVSFERPQTLRIVFATQYLERTGAPILLTNLVRRISNFNVSVHSPVDGPLRETLTEAGIPVTIGALDLDDVDLVVANTIAAAYAVQAAKAAGVPCVWMIHESDPAMCRNLDDVLGVIDYPSRLIFPCQATADAYATYRTTGVEILPTVIPPVPIRDRALARQALGLDPSDFVVITMGHDEPRKGQADIREAIR